MGFSLAIREAAFVELIREEKFVRIAFSHSDTIPGETSLTFPAHFLPEIISSLRALAAHAGIDVKASWDGETLQRIYDHAPEDVGRPINPPRRIV